MAASVSVGAVRIGGTIRKARRSVILSRQGDDPGGSVLSEAVALREGHWIVRGPEGGVVEIGSGVAGWLSRLALAEPPRQAIDQAIEQAIEQATEVALADAGSVSGSSSRGGLQVQLLDGRAGFLLDRLVLPGSGELLLVFSYLESSAEGEDPALAAPGGPGSGARSSRSNPDADEAQRLGHLIRGHLATRLLAPLAHLAGPPRSGGIEAGPLGDEGFQERLVRYVTRAMENVLVLASEVLPEARRTPNPAGWVELSRLLNLLAGSFVSPVGARVNQRIEVKVDGPIWIRVRRPQLRLLLELCLEIVLSTGLDARLEVRRVEPWPTLHLSALPAPASATWGVGDLSLVPAAQALAKSLGLPLDFNLGSSGLAEMQMALEGCGMGQAPVVGLVCLDQDLLDLLSAMLESVGVAAVDLNATAPGEVARSAPRGLDVILVDLDSLEESSTRLLAELRRQLPKARMLALTSEPVVDEAWNAIATKPVSVSRLVELMEFVGE